MCKGSVSGRACRLTTAKYASCAYASLAALSVVALGSSYRTSGSQIWKKKKKIWKPDPLTPLCLNAPLAAQALQRNLQAIGKAVEQRALLLVSSERDMPLSLPFFTLAFVFAFFSATGEQRKRHAFDHHAPFLCLPRSRLPWRAVRLPRSLSLLPILLAPPRGKDPLPRPRTSL